MNQDNLTIFAWEAQQLYTYAEFQQHYCELYEQFQKHH